jgi:RNA polymerase sigma-70 factor (ECF subfamily)
MRPELIQASDLLSRNTPEAVEEAIGLLQNTVYSFSMKVCGHPEDAEDTMQEVLSRSPAHLTKIQGPKALAVWLYTVTRNRCWRLRRKSVYAPKKTLSLDELMPDGTELARLIADVAKTPEATMLQGEEHHQLHQAILRVPAQLRIVLVLHDIEELSTDDVAQVLNLRPGTVRVRLHRARLLVRKEMNSILAEVPVPKSPASKQSPAKKISRKSAKRPLECREIFSNLSEYLDNRLEARTCEEMREHIEACPACVAFLRDLRSAIDRCHSLEVPCHPVVATRLRAILTKEYLRMIGKTA